MIHTFQLGQLGLSRRSNTTLWTPASLAVPAAIWLNESSTLVTQSGAPTRVETWPDSSGNSRDMGYIVANNQRPLIVNPGLASKRTIQFDSLVSSRLLRNQSGAVGLYANASAGWLACVYKWISGSTANRILLEASSNTNGNARLWLQSDSASGSGLIQLRVRRLDADTATTLNAATNTGDGNWHMVLATMDWANRVGKIYIDGTQDASNSTLTTAGSTSNTNSFDVAIGGCTSGSNSNTEVAEAFFGTTLPSSTEIDKLFGYLAYRWGLQGNLPGGHPYKTSPP